MNSQKVNVLLTATAYLIGFIIQVVAILCFKGQTNIFLTFAFGSFFFGLAGDLLLTRLLPQKLFAIKIFAWIHAVGCAFGCILFFLHIAGVNIPGEV